MHVECVFTHMCATNMAHPDVNGVCILTLVTSPHVSAPVLPTPVFLGSSCQTIHANTHHLSSDYKHVCVQSQPPRCVCTTQVCLCTPVSQVHSPESPGEQDTGADGRRHCLVPQAAWVPRMTPLLIPLQALPARTHRPPDVLVSLDADRAHRGVWRIPTRSQQLHWPPAPFPVPSAALIVPYPCWAAKAAGI